jgi:hypothetical protein
VAAKAQVQIVVSSDSQRTLRAAAEVHLSRGARSVAVAAKDGYSYDCDGSPTGAHTWAGARRGDVAEAVAFATDGVEHSDTDD